MKVKFDYLIESGLSWLEKEIETLDSETRALSEKVKMRECQINQTSADLQDSYNKLIKQSHKECEISLKDILNSQLEQYFEHSKETIENHLEQMHQQITNETSKYQHAQSLANQLAKYEQQIKETSNHLSNQLKLKMANLSELHLQYTRNTIKKLHTETNSQVFERSCEKQISKLTKLKEEIAQLDSNCNLLVTKRNQTYTRIQKLADSTSTMLNLLQISIFNRPILSFSHENHEIINVPPVYQAKKKVPERNVLVLAPIHSLTRKMHSTKGAPNFFSTKSFH